MALGSVVHCMVCRSTSICNSGMLIQQAAASHPAWAFCSLVPVLHHLRRRLERRAKVHDRWAPWNSIRKGQNSPRRGWASDDSTQIYSSRIEGATAGQDQAQPGLELGRRFISTEDLEPKILPRSSSDDSEGS